MIFKVYEEKEQAWQREFKKLRAIYETKLKASQQRLFKAEQTLQVQNQQVLIYYMQNHCYLTFFFTLIIIIIYA